MVFSFAQEGQPFHKRVEHELKGEVVMISNNILNKGGNPNKPYNDVNEKAKLNDEFMMEYIDIDNDKSTFSSSSANLTLKNPNSKIIYAGLYWSATYKYGKGKLDKEKKFVVVDNVRGNFDEIKIKLPNQLDYIDIKGTIIFDGHKIKDYITNAPYAVFADITEYVNNLDQPYGTYTVANIKATEGIISGGSSAGWTMIFIVEDQTKNNKYITVYDGFVGVTKKNTDVVFDGFKALPNGSVNAIIYGSALEGDLNMRGDKLLIKSEKSNEFIALEDQGREYDNFFKSSISYDGVEFLDRNPNSRNTLGYDSFKLSISNSNNDIISNDTDNITLRLTSYGDRYFMFMTALEIEVLETKKQELIVSTSEKSVAVSQVEEKQEQVISVQKTENIVPEKVVVTESQSEKSVEVLQVEEKAEQIVSVQKIENIVPEKVAVTESQSEKSVAVSQVEEKSETTSIETKPTIKTVELTSKERGFFNVTQRSVLLKSESFIMERVPKGYYLVSGYFSKRSSAIKKVMELRNQKIEANYFINPKDKNAYVYCAYAENYQDATRMYTLKSSGEDKYKYSLFLVENNQINFDFLKMPLIGFLEK